MVAELVPSGCLGDPPLVLNRGAHFQDHPTTDHVQGRQRHQALLHEPLQQVLAIRLLLLFLLFFLLSVLLRGPLAATSAALSLSLELLPRPNDERVKGLPPEPSGVAVLAPSTSSCSSSSPSASSPSGGPKYMDVPSGMPQKAFSSPRSTS